MSNYEDLDAPGVFRYTKKNYYGTNFYYPINGNAVAFLKFVSKLPKPICISQNQINVMRNVGLNVIVDGEVKGYNETGK